MGACDMHLVEAPFFAPGMELTIDVRTKIRYDYSYIESAAIKIGDDVLVEDLSKTSPYTCLRMIEGRYDDVCYFIAENGKLK